MKSIITTSILLLAVAAGLAAQARTNGDGVAGTWEVVVKGPAAHGDLTATMELQQEGTKVTGTLSAHGATHSLAGEFTSGELSLETTDDDKDHEMTLNARLADDGTLSGYLSSARGDMRWTASRTKVRK